MTFHPDSLGDLSGRVYVVTGGNAGIGYYSVLYLARHNARVYLCSRSSSKGNEAISSIKKIHPDADIRLLEMDHLDLASVVSAAGRFLSQETQLHGLLNNAGIMAVPFAMTTDGHESEWQTNYLAHWAFTKHLLPTLLATSRTCPPGTVRVVNLTSSGHFLAPKGGINFTDPTNKSGGGWSRYGQSKLANILHSKILNQTYGPNSKTAKSGQGEIWTAAVHPGLVDTQLAAGAGSNYATMEKMFKLIGAYINPDEGSYTSLFTVASKDFKREQSGKYFERVAKPGWESCHAKDLELAEKLEKWTSGEMIKEGWVRDES